MGKLLFNSTHPITETRFMCCDINNFYIGTPMVRYEHILLPINITWDGIITQYNLRVVEKNKHVYDDTRKVMYSLPQARQIENDFLTQNIAPHGYYHCRHTPVLWRHKWIPVNFSLVADDFGVKFVVKSVGKKHTENLITCINKEYFLSVDWTGELYCGVSLDWE